MRRKILLVGMVMFMLLSAVYLSRDSAPTVEAMKKNDDGFLDKVIDFDDYTNRNYGDYKPEPRLFIPPSEESLKLTQEQVQSFDCNTVEDVSVLECEALVALYASTNGAGWTDNTHWLQSTTVNDWYGVGAMYGFVKTLSLESNNLIGNLPPEIRNLENLTIFTLPNNFLNGNIPNELYQMKIVYFINLAGNQLTGSISSSLGQARNLAFLNLAGNQLTGSIPDEIGDLFQLRDLSLSSNKLSGELPSSLGYLGNLYSLSISDNLITGSIPAKIGNLDNLSHLWMRDNRLTGNIPPELASLQELRVLRLENNLLTGSIPPEFKNLRLWDLYLTNNRLSGEIPPEIGQMRSLENLMLSNNQLSGEIPGELFDEPPLYYLSLAGNRLSGSIPSTIGQMRGLRSINLARNQLSGTIPAEIGNINGLKSLILADNKIEGAIPENFTKLVHLDWTDLGYNRLNVPQEEPVQSFLNEKDPDWHLTQATQLTIPCAEGGDITSRDGMVKVAIPAGACDGDVDFLLAPFSEPRHDYGALHWAKNGFELSAQNAQGAVTQFQKPLSFTLYYLDENTGPLPEDQLVVEMFNEESLVWQDAVYTCPDGEYTRQLTENWLKVPVCHLSDFGLFNKSDLPLRLFFPMEFN